MKHATPFEFRRTDGRVVYRFDPENDGPPLWRRTDLDLRCLRTLDGWRIVDADGRVLGWPQGDSRGDEPPAGPWFSSRGWPRVRLRACLGEKNIPRARGAPTRVVRGCPSTLAASHSYPRG